MRESRSRGGAKRIHFARANPRTAVTMSEEERRIARVRLSAGDVEVTSVTNAQDVRTRTIGIGELDDREVYSMLGVRLGGIERVVADGNNRRYVVIGTARRPPPHQIDIVTM